MTNLSMYPLSLDNVDRLRKWNRNCLTQRNGFKRIPIVDDSSVDDLLEDLIRWAAF